MEYSIASFGLEAGVDAHLSAFLENIFEFKTNNNSDFASYLDYWEKKEGIKVLLYHRALTP